MTDMMLVNPAVKYRWRVIRSLLDIGSSSQPVRFLDIGCGEGSFAADLLRRYPNIEIAGIDASNTGVAMARARLPGVRFHRVDLLADGENEFPELTGWATHALCSEVLEHVDAPSRLLRRASQFLSAGATLVLTVPAGPMSAQDRQIGHRKHYTPALLAREATESGFEGLQILRAGFPFHNFYRLLVVFRGQSVIREAARPVAANSLLTRAALQVFNWFFVLNLPRTPWGWQIVARVRAPSPTPPEKPPEPAPLP